MSECVQEHLIDGNDSGAANDLHLIGCAQRELGQYESALESFKQARALFKKLKEVINVARCDQKIAHCLTALGDAEGALVAAQKSLDVFVTAHDHRRETYSLFELGKAQHFSTGKDISIFACGHMVWNAIQAGVQLEEKGISVEVINIHTIKPLDEAAVIASLQKTRCAVTAEEHNIIGGLGDSIAQVAAKHCPVPIEYVGTKDTFGESGTPAQLLKKYGLDVPDIVAAAERALKRKG